MELSNNIRLIREVARLSRDKFGEILGVTGDVLYTYETGRSKPKQFILGRIANFAGVPLQKLIGGPLTESDINIDSNNYDNVEKEKPSYETITFHNSNIKQGEGKKKIPVFEETSVSAGGVGMYDDNPEKPSYSIEVPGFEDVNFAVHVYGSSMVPLIESGSFILCKKVNPEVILWGEIYYIRTDDYRMVKRLQKGIKGKTLVAISENEEQRKDGSQKYEPIEIKLERIKELYLVKGIIKKIQI